MFLRYCVMLRGSAPRPSTAAALPPPPARWAAPSVERADASDANDTTPVALGGDLPPLSARLALSHLRAHCVDTMLDVYAAFLAFGSQLITLETLLVAAVAAGAVFAFCDWFSAARPGSKRRLASNLNWTIFATVVVFPLCVRQRCAARERERERGSARRGAARRDACCGDAACDTCCARGH